jgi:hypothetical protein
MCGIAGFVGSFVPGLADRMNADTTPWRHLERDGVGWDLPLDDEQRFANRIHEAAQLSNQAYRLWRKRVRDYARKRLDKPEVITANRRLFIEALDNPPAN